MTEKILRAQYELLCKYYGLHSSCLAMLHENFSRYTFCEANRKSLIAEYLLWEEFVEHAKKLNFTYYYGIDEFIREYKKAVYSCLNL